ncbi:glycosyltransferase family 4 protein [Iamia majanohamensis]|uniref:Glycosyltransferase family 4 protein n=1 Tax=Iamia majanohamensis TaxID=467976 RepID=A0AAF0BUX3_9ACTN|nr:glycosyltransferase family 4 protein [Iamia majanohamensis]WCO65844.1 glycosyltransferase family 4 protein [Iamia majanohamensis]
MKVVHVIDALGVGGGAEHSLATLLPELRERGVESSVVCLRPREGGLQAALTAAGVEVTVLPGRPGPRQVRALRRIVRERRPDLVHATLLPACLTARFACPGLGVPLLNSLVNTTYDPVRVRLAGLSPTRVRAWRVIDGLTARHLVDHLHVLSEAVRAEAVGVLGVDRARTTLIPRGRSASDLGRAGATRRTSVRQALGVADEEPLVVNVARQDLQKGQDVLLRAWPRVLAAHPRATLLLVGREGAASARLRDEARTLDASVRMLGHRDDAVDLVAAADLFAFPSLYEGLGCAVIEAMALETPVVASDAPALIELLEGGDLGVVVPRGDAEALGDALVALLADPGRRAGLAARARTVFLDRYELAAVADLTVTLYQELAARG